MIGETFLVVSSSLFVFCSAYEIRKCTGYIVFHAILTFVSSSNVLKWTHESDWIKLRPVCNSGIALGCVLVPMVITSQISMLKLCPTCVHHDDLVGTLEYYLHASQLMGMCLVSILVLVNKSRRSWLILLTTTACMAATLNSQQANVDVKMRNLVGLVLLFIVLLVFLLWLFPKSFSLCEAMLITQACLFLAVDSWTSVGSRLYYVVPSVAPPPYPVTRSVYTYWLQILLVGSLLTGLLLLPVFYYISIVRNSLELWIGTISFYIVIFLVFISFLLPWTYLMLGGVNPFYWMIHYLTYNSLRLCLVVYWSCITLLSLAVVLIKNATSTTMQSTTITRKYFHILAMAVFVPGIILEPLLTHLAASIAIAGFIFIEYIRMGRILPLGNILHDSLQMFLDEKDTGCVILSHVYLLLGCALPIWLYPGNVVNTNKKVCLLALYSGIVCLGIGDTLASVIGKKFGKWTWPGTCKTIEGTTAGFVAQLVCIVILSQSGLVFVTNWLAVSCCLIASSLLEAWTTQIDNLVLPPFFFSLVLTSCT